MEKYIFFTLLILIFIGVHLYHYIDNRKNHQKFINKFDKSKIIFIKNIKVDLETNGFFTTLNKVDLLIDNKNFYLLPYNFRVIPGKILQFGESEFKNHKEVFHVFIIQQRHRVQGKLRLKGIFRTTFSKANFKLFLDFRGTDLNVDGFI